MDITIPGRVKTEVINRYLELAFGSTSEPLPESAEGKVRLQCTTGGLVSSHVDARSFFSKRLACGGRVFAMWPLTFSHLWGWAVTYAWSSPLASLAD